MESNVILTEFETRLAELVKACALFGLSVGSEFKKADADTWAKIVHLFNTGQAELVATLTLSPQVHVELALGSGADRKVLFSSAMCPSGASIN